MKCGEAAFIMELWPLSRTKLLKQPRWKQSFSHPGAT